MLPGSYTFSTASPECMTVVKGECGKAKRNGQWIILFLFGRSLLTTQIAVTNEPSKNQSGLSN